MPALRMLHTVTSGRCRLHAKRGARLLVGRDVSGSAMQWLVHNRLAELEPATEDEDASSIRFNRRGWAEQFRLTPEEYLRRWPAGPNAALARRVIEEQP